MRPENQSKVSKFLLLGVPIPSEQQGMFFALFLGMYPTMVVGNLLIILLIRLDSCLHTLMYFFLSHWPSLMSPLAFTDISFSSIIVPRMLINMCSQDQSIPNVACISQVYFINFSCTYGFLLAVMTCDRYVAICHPLHYTTIMRGELCIILVAGSWFSSCGHALLHTLLVDYNMRRENQSSVSEFILLGVPIPVEQQGLFFALFLGMYLSTVLGNLLIILLIRLDSRLHTPMYFFLSHLAFTDVSFSSVTVPKMLLNMHTQHLSISYPGCISQMYFYLFLGCVDSLLLAVMAYDRYVAICHPLHYTTIMKEGPCVLLVAGSWILSCGSALLHTLLLVQVSFCADNIIPHFFCSLSILLRVSCSNTSLHELVIFTAGGATVIFPLSGILVSYGHIGVTILKVPSTKGICKALSTCGSHLSVVSLFYGTIIALYFSSSSSNSNDKDMIVSLMYTVVTPMLNPFIYSLRNRDMKLALGILFRNNILFAK
ncbi:PREDICTED: LOW QUALITY PROTEIN: olfactory receptor 1J4-like [Ceratotherium simum simum]|uniref:LOW QUALITY PROTEIN: olfactory receptor 1J4-like n=1 Tax=Ceratotherium simum simum TaxID=73337 RepID=A0ABM1CCZ0_CERSS|nr:PREDICTED: LOW QUALITY PROTEIN: olfactory receptor 1J4-like [Ceratotherium simum simum]